jgi:hypothetical protein
MALAAPPPIPTARTTSHIVVQTALARRDRPLYRFFREEKHADDLRLGSVWISTLETCRRHEDPQQGDQGEGIHQYSISHVQGGSGDKEFERMAAQAGIHLAVGAGAQNVTIREHVSVNRLIDAYVICTTEQFDPAKLSPTFGEHCVRISSALRFFQAVNQRLLPFIDCKEAVLAPITYSDRHYADRQTPPGLLGFVKPSDMYADQQEVRAMWTVN